MPRLIYTERALNDLIRVREFLATKSPEAADKAKRQILESLGVLTTFPEAHRPVPDLPMQRELVIKFGSYGYIARYHYVKGGDVTVLLIKHQREEDLPAG